MSDSNTKLRCIKLAAIAQLITYCDVCKWHTIYYALQYLSVIVLISNVPLHTDNCVLIVTERTVSIANIMTID